MDINRALGPYGPYGSIATDICKQTNRNCPNYRNYHYSNYPICNGQHNPPCESKASRYLTLILPDILTSNIVQDNSVNINVQTIPLVATYRTVLPNYILKIVGDNENRVINNTGGDSLALKIDSHVANGETYPAVDFLLTNEDTLQTISKTVTGSADTLFNVVIVYKSNCHCETDNSLSRLPFRQNLTFRIVSISMNTL